MDGSGPRFVDAPFDPPADVWDTGGPGRSPDPPPPAPRRGLLRWWPLALVSALLAVAAGSLLRSGDTPGTLLPRDATVQAIYLADEGVLRDAAFARHDAVSAADEQLHGELWAEWSSMVPPYWSRRVTRFEIASDGAGGVAAAVQRLDDAGDRWLLSVDPVDAVERRGQYLHTLVHELAHIVTLGAGRVEVDPRPARTLVEQAARCAGPPVVEGCAAPGSVLAAFSEAFWDLDEVGAPDGVATTGDRDEATVARYLAARDSYVSVYAASGPGEDLAETFAAMALDHRLAPGSVAAAKVDMLRADPELFALADRIRATLRDR